MRLHKVFTFIISTAISFVAFTAITLGIQATGLVSVSSVPAVSTPLSQIDAEEQAWLALGIDSYRIEIEQSFLPLFVPSIITTVRDGEIVEQFCTEENTYCESWLQDPRTANQFTVQGLFAIARQAQFRLAENPAQYYVDLNYDSTYHFPTLIRITQWDVDDGVSAWSVLSFELLP